MARKDKKATAEYNKKWREQNRAKCVKYATDWRNRNREHVKEYRREYIKLWEKKNKRKLQGYRLKRKYGVTVDEKDSILKNQLNQCGICSNEFRNSKDAHLDHDHITKKIRGILCGRCNRALGYFKDNKDILKNAIIYLEKHKG